MIFYLFFLWLEAAVSAISVVVFCMRCVVEIFGKTTLDCALLCHASVDAHNPDSL